jgi:phenylalanyl-tRNA synthetase beta subunit
MWTFIQLSKLERKLSFSVIKFQKFWGYCVLEEVKDILKRYNFEYKNDGDIFEMTVPYMRYDLVIEEDMAEEMGRILGYDKVKPEAPKINFKPQVNEAYIKMLFARNKLLNDGYSEVMTYVFRDKGEVEVLASASDKKFLRTNLLDGLKESLKLNQANIPLLGMKRLKFLKSELCGSKKLEKKCMSRMPTKKILQKFP